MERLGGRRDDIWQDRYIYEIALAIHDLLVEKERKGENRKTEPQTMIYPQVDGITPSVIETQTERSER